MCECRVCESEDEVKCPRGHEGDDCGAKCHKCKQAMCTEKDNYECWGDQYYCLYCMSDVVKEDARTMTLDDMCDSWDSDSHYIYSWLYDCDEETLCESVETISNWWLTQRKS